MTDEVAIQISIDPVTLVSQECIRIISEIRKNSRFFQSGVAAILSSSDTINLFNDEFISNFKSLKFTDVSSGKKSSHNSGIKLQTHSATGSSSNNNSNDPVLGAFLQLKSLLSEIDSLKEIDSLTILQPYFMLLTSPSTSGLITSITLNSLTRLFEYEILFNACHHTNIETNVNQLIDSLTHISFESSDPSLDDSVLFKVLELILRIIKNDNYNIFIANDVFSEVIQISLSLACNKKRSEVLRRYAEQVSNSITIIVFNKLRYLSTDQSEKKHLSIDLNFFYQYFSNLISIVSVENQYYHTESTKIFVLRLLSTILETSGKMMPNHPQLLKLVSNQLFKNLLTIILKNDSLNLLQAALQCFICLNLILSEHLTLQLEFAYENIFKSILPADDFYGLDESIDENSNPPLKAESSKSSTSTNGASSSSTRTSTPVTAGTSGAIISSRNPLAKELIIESLSLLWSHSSDLLINLFINFDCKFDSKNISLIFIKFLNKLAESSSASITTNNVPPICLEGLLQFINGLNVRVKKLKRQGIEFDSKRFEENKILKLKARKEEFLNILNTLNNDDFKTGIKELRARGFLSSGLDEVEEQEELGEFFYFKASLLNKKAVGEFIAKPKNLTILINFLSHFSFQGKRVDESLRLLLEKFRIPGESQQIERVVENFASKYVDDQNFEKVVEDYEAAKAAFADGKIKKEPIEPVTPEKDGVFILSYAIIMLNTDLHNPKIKEHMKFEEFKKNLRGVYKEGKDYPEWYLKSIYNSINSKEIIIPEEHYGTDKWFTGSWDLLMSINPNSQKNFSFAFEKAIEDPHRDEDEYQKINSNGIAIEDLDVVIVSHFDKVLFNSSYAMLIKSFLHVFEETSDDHRIAKLMSIIDKCANIASYYQLDDVLDSILDKLARSTTLTGEKKSDVTIGDDEFIRDVIPTTQLTLLKNKTPVVAIDPNVDKIANEESLSDSAILYGSRRNIKGESSVSSSSIPISRTSLETTDNDPDIITISETSTWFGRDFKAQISFIALFNIIRRGNFNQLSKSLSKVVMIILKLFDNGMIDGNFFGKFQQEYQLPKLPIVRPQYIIDHTTTKKENEVEQVSLFSAFTSYLKINSDEPPEPTNEEIDATLSALNCIATSKIEQLFEFNRDGITLSNVPSKELIFGFLKMLPNYSKSNKLAYQSDVLFIFESTVALSVMVKDQPYYTELAEKIMKDIDKLIVINEKNHQKLLDEMAMVRLLGYELILFNHLHDKFDNVAGILKRGIQLLATIDGSKQGILDALSEFIEPELVKIVKESNDADDWKHLVVLTLEEYWKLLRNIASLTAHVDKVFEFMNELVVSYPNKIVPENYMAVLGLFDEVSSMGAIGSTYEQELELFKLGGGDSGKELPSTNPHQNLIGLSKKSIDLTLKLREVVIREDFVTVEKKTKTSCWYSLIQALGHQTFNPCREIRGHALKMLTHTLLSWDITRQEYVSARGIFELDIFPLVTELLKDEVLYCDYYGMAKTKQDVLSNIVKIYLQYLNKFYIAKQESYDEGSELSYIWLNLLDVFQNLVVDETHQIETQQMAPKKKAVMMKNKKKKKALEPVIRESSKELIKNSLLYMHDCGYLEVKNENHQYLWKETWNRIGKMYPELEAEFKKELEEIDKMPMEAPEKKEVSINEESENKQAEEVEVEINREDKDK
ncbi:Arf family guanine nucleotide exchange factor [Saccharomycopsis crataegensis]|uniref:Arf family guanine nucleotide exchange factor n=1 Tax=Saccharomycopsis crataegensis TaxID=43959 RepID=A0AAV5QN07_9ASCO|nr:Arf family guanine nucleotide exchange factor [Saccharomycopsis crataegensis]